MKAKYLYLIIAAASILASCQKDNVKAPGASETKISTGSQSNIVAGPLTGRWQETKLILQMTDQAGAKIGDTVYAKQLLTSDYVQFNADGSCVLSQGQNYATSGIQGGAHNTPFNLTQESSMAILNYSGPIGTMGFPGPDTLYMQDANTVLIHSVATLMNGSAIVSDAYYTR